MKNKGLLLVLLLVLGSCQQYSERSPQISHASIGNTNVAHAETYLFGSDEKRMNTEGYEDIQVTIHNAGPSTIDFISVIMTQTGDEQVFKLNSKPKTPIAANSTSVFEVRYLKPKKISLRDHAAMIAITYGNTRSEESLSMFGLILKPKLDVQFPKTPPKT